MIAGEINTIKEQVRATALNGAVEIGRRLQEAKALVPEGEWTRWLKDNVDYSLRTAQNMMALASEYGGNQTQALARLSYTQAVLLLALPEEEREEFVESHDMEEMSTRELKRQLEALKGEKADMQLTMDQMIAEKKALETDRNEAKAALTTARQVSKSAMDAEKKLKGELQAARNELASAQEAAQKEKEALERALKEAPRPVFQQVAPPDMERELADLRAQLARSNAEEAMRASYDVLRSCYVRIQEQLRRMEDAERAAQLRAALGKGLRLMAGELDGKEAGA